MNLFELGATLGLDSADFDRGLTDAENKSNKSGGQIGRAINGGMKVVAGAMIAGATGSIAFGSNFEASMSQVAATMGITADKSNKDFKILSDAAKNAGSTTKYSASEASEALNYLALAGYDAQKSASMLPKVLNLASAGGLDLAYASDLVTDSMSALGIEAEFADGFIDQLAKTSQKSNTSVGQLGEAILTVGGTAKVLAGGTYDLNTALGILADNGIKGSEGGTALRNTILSLTAPTDKAAKLMKQFGIDVFDANGEMLPMQQILQDLDRELSKMTTEEKTNFMSDVFNKNDLKAINALLANSGERWDELQGHIEEAAGSAEDMANTMSNNLAGSVKNFMSKVEALGIAVYEKFQVPLTNAVDWAIEGLGNIITKFENGDLEGIIDGIGVAVSTLTGLFLGMKAIQLATSIISWVGAFTKLATSQGIVTAAQWALNIAMTANPIGIIVVAIGALIGALVGLFVMNEDFRNFVIGAWNAIKQAGINTWDWLVKTFTETIPNAFQSMYVWFQELPGRIGTWFSETWEKTKQWGIDMWNSALETGTNFIEGIKQWFKDLPYTIGFWIGETSVKVYQWSVEMWERAKETGTNFINSIKEWFSTLPERVSAWFNDTWSKTKQWGSDMWNTAKETGSSFINSIKEWFSSLPGRIAEWFRNTWNKAVQFKDDMVKKAKETGKEFTEWLVNSVKDLPKKFSEIGKNIVQGVWNGIVNMKNWIVEKVGGFFGGIVDGAKKALGIHSPSRVFRDVVGKQIPAGVEVGIRQGMPNLENTLDKEMLGLTEGYSFTGNVNTIGQETPISGKIELKIENFYNNTKQDIEQIADELTFMIEKKRYALGGI